jgi:hypothetical protein
VGGCIERQNNVHLTENHYLCNLTALKALPALEEVRFVQMAGKKEKDGCYKLYEVAVVMAGLTSKEYKIMQN